MNHVDLEIRQQQWIVKSVSQHTKLASERRRRKEKKCSSVRCSVVCVGHCVQWPLNLPAVVRPTLEKCTHNAFAVHLCAFRSPFLMLLSNAMPLLFVAHFTWRAGLSVFFLFASPLLGLACLKHQLTHFSFWLFPKERILSFFLSSPYNVRYIDPIGFATATATKFFHGAIERNLEDFIFILFVFISDFFCCSTFWEFLDFAKIFCFLLLGSLRLVHALTYDAMSWVALFGQLRFYLMLWVCFMASKYRFYTDPFISSLCSCSAL